MSFQAYLDAVEAKTGLTPREVMALAEERGFGPSTKAGEILDWLKDDFDLGRGHGMAMVHVIKNGPGIGDKHVTSGGVHADESNELWLDGQANKPADWGA
jgi:hypothetical protein